MFSTGTFATTDSDLYSLLHRVVFVREKALRTGLDLKRIGLYVTQITSPANETA